MKEQSPESPPIAFKDRSTGLRVFGTLTILLGCLCALLVPLMFLGQMMAAKTGGETATNPSILPVAGVYGFLAVALIWLGIGSLNARRWAQVLILIFSWTWLIFGVVGLVFTALVLPAILANMQADLPQGQTLTPGVKLVVMTISVMVLFVFFVVLPRVWILFYRSPDVIKTCAARNPMASWTDACPMPVLNMSLWLGLSTLILLAMPLSYRGVFPFFGTFISGLPGTMMYLLFAAMMGYSAYAMYKLDIRGWWVNFAAFGVALVSNVATYSRHDLMEFYRLAGYSEQRIERMQQLNLFSGSAAVWGSLLFTLPFLVYLIYLKKFFRRAQ